jgi:hypothetical protein
VSYHVSRDRDAKREFVPHRAVHTAVQLSDLLHKKFQLCLCSIHAVKKRFVVPLHKARFFIILVAVMCGDLTKFTAAVMLRYRTPYRHCMKLSPLFYSKQ